MLPMPTLPRALMLVLLSPMAGAVNGTVEHRHHRTWSLAGKWKPHREHTSVSTMLKKREGCPLWCKMSRGGWERKCKYEKCGGSCWDCKWSDTFKAYNFELTWYREHARLQGESLIVPEDVKPGGVTTAVGF
ncbi:unnamed protein product [Prorocentrum cordatum]|uniref:Uncharacterized protein n=1 Tax=Prorocentrum cordatum TaxID=2364126 RepID=A0ABN9TFF7_9DINO|nr:unnamed protein product [Polarella glacialis]